MIDAMQKLVLLHIGRLFSVCCVLSVCLTAHAALGANLQQTIREAQTKVVKIYGAGGLRGMEAYQTGILISPTGDVLTTLSYVLDTDDLTVILDDGRKWQAELVGSDPVRELAVLQLATEEQSLAFFDLHEAVEVNVGQRVLALSNLFGIATGDEPVSVLQGVVTAKAPLDARRGSQRTTYRDRVVILDVVANNPGAAGGALIDWHGRLVGVLGKELRSRLTGTWLNYALPAQEISQVVDDIKAGKELQQMIGERVAPEKALSAESLGCLLVPDVLPRTPPYIDSVRSGSPADLAGLRVDDLIVFVDREPIASCADFHRALGFRELDGLVSLSILRDGELLEFQLHTEDVLPTVGDEKETAPRQ